MRDRRMVRVFLVSMDHAFLALSRPQFRANRCCCVGEAGNPEGALKSLEDTNPDVVVFDTEIYNRFGPPCIKNIKLCHPALPLIVLADSPDEDFVTASIVSGATGILDRTSFPKGATEGLRQAAEGGAPLSQPAARALVGYIFKTRTDAQAAFGLTNRQEQLMAYLMQPKTMKEIAQEWGVSHETIHSHQKALYKKLGADSREDAIHHWLGYRNHNAWISATPTTQPRPLSRQ